MKKSSSIPTAIGLLMLCAGCSSHEPKAVLGDFLGAYESYCADMGNAGRAEDVVAALTKATARMQDLTPRMNGLTQEYPEIKDLQNGAPLPDVLRDLEPRVAGLGRKQMMAIAHAGPYLKDPQVVAAQKKFGEAMNAMIHYREIGYVEP